MPFTTLRPFAAACLTAAATVAALAVSPASAQRTKGIDVSQFQGSMDWNTAYDAGVRFAFVRATRGGLTDLTAGVDDTRYDQNVARLAALGASGRTIHNSAYHFGRPDTIPLPGGTGQPSRATLRRYAADEATHFVSVAGAQMVPGALRPVLDLEAGGGDLTRANLSFWANAFMDEVESLTGAEPLVYMNSNYAINFVDDSLAGRDLWIANYTTTRYGNPVTGTGGPPTGAFDDWNFWQYSADGNGRGAEFGASSRDIDLDVAHGDLSFVEQFLIPAPQSAVPEPASLALVAGAGLALLRRRP